MSILITGGTGYIGSHTCVELLKENKEIVVLDNLSNSDIEVVDKIEKITGKTFPFYKIDILDRAALNKIFQRHEISSVVHFAGLKAVGESVKKPLEYYQNNITGALNLLEIMRENYCKNLVFSSSATVYGDNPNIPFKEDFPVSATNPYGQTKIMIEQILKDIAVSDDQWSIALLRYFNPIGAHSSGIIGENPKGIPNNLLPYIAKVAAGELPFLNVFGDDYNTTDGTGVRDYIHVVDLAKGHLKAISYVEKNSGIQAINLGTGKGYSVLEVVKAYEKVSGKKIDYKIQPRRTGDIAACYADSSKAKKILGWQSEFELEQMCRDSWNFIIKQSS